MSKLRVTLTFVTLLAIGACQADRTNGTSDRPVLKSYASFSPQAAPADVREEFKSRHPAAEIISVAKRTYPDGTSDYEVEYLEGGQKRKTVLAGRSQP